MKSGEWVGRWSGLVLPQRTHAAGGSAAADRSRLPPLPTACSTGTTTLTEGLPTKKGVSMKTLLKDSHKSKTG